MASMLQHRKKWIVIGSMAIAIVLVLLLSARPGPVDFNTQVKPLLNQKCISCHGGVKKQAGFSVLFREEALAATESGKPAIVPGDPDNSEFIRRLSLDDPEERMPYEHPPLNDDEISLLRRWVKEGAQWGKHWAYIPLSPVTVPKPEPSFFGLIKPDSNHWISNNIDYFIFDEMQEINLQPSPIADKATLLRRVSLDLTGLPAPHSIANRFLSDSSGNAYEVLIDSLLASTRFGERWTALWMDIARYSDTKGYERDPHREIWRYRDWLIKAFNEDKPYDVFLTEQIAGDLIPGATDNDYIATAFHRNTMTNDEGGTDNEEFRTAAIVDRVNTTWEALMGTSFSCVQCHSHPYDPFKHEDYYRFLAYFNNTRDEDTQADYPLLRHFDSAQQAKLAQLNSWLLENTNPEKAADWIRLVKTWQPSINSLTADSFLNSEIVDTKWLSFRNNAHARLKKVNLSKKTQLIFRYQTGYTDGIMEFHIGSPEGPLLKRLTANKTKGWFIQTIEIPETVGTHDLFIRYSNKHLKNPDQEGLMVDWLHFAEKFPGDKNSNKSALMIFNELLSANVPGTPIMMENPKDFDRKSFVFERGNWLVPGEEVKPGVPEIFNASTKIPPNRLGLAAWLTDIKNPLTARTMVNRLWEQLFGVGLVETLEDMGSQGAEPTHPELLDYLSYKFMTEYKWSMKQLLRELVMSSTYRQSSVITKEMQELDPYNKFYARASRIRLSAEQLRDQGLSVSGLLSDKMYGPGVKPFQPEGIWLSPYNGEQWVKSDGEDQYRRAVYTYWKRTAPYPSMITFDGVSREVCLPRRIRTNTPLQALVTLNDEVYVEMARHLAYRMKEKGGSDLEKQLKAGYEMILYKPLPKQTLQVLQQLYTKAYESYKNDPDKTCKMVGIMNEHNNPQTASLIVVANAMMNLDEVVTRN